jgi:hypothetical protein
MFKDFIEYDFNGEINDYVTSYDPTKLNMGYLMTRNQDTDGKTYVTPVETKFLRGFEIGGSATFQINSLGFLKYNNNVSWVFYTNTNDIGNVAKRIFLATYDKVNNLITEIGSINVNYTPNTSHGAVAITPSLENHTGGTVSVVGNAVSGSGTTWSTDGVCSGNRIGFGSTDPNQITQWYTISSVVDNTNIIISREYLTDGIIENLNLSGGTPYVIEDFRLIYANRNSSGGATVAGIALVKGLRYENFTQSPTTIPAATTVDNLRACYRILDSATTSATFAPIGLILEDKVSFTEQYIYSAGLPFGSTNLNIQRFNIRAALTVTAGRSDSAFNFTTGTLAHGGTNIFGGNTFIKGSNSDYYINLATRISRIIPANITNGSTNFIGDTMIEIPLGNIGTFPLSSQLQGFHYLPNANKFYISHTQGTIRNYITSYSTVGGQFERVVNLNDTIESNTYVVSELDTLTSNFISAPLRTFYHDGLSYIARDVNNNRNVLYTLPIEADKEYHTTTKACIITPEFTTPNTVNYDKVYLNTKSTFNNGRFISPSENVDVYFRTTGTTDDSGSWTLVDTTGDISYATGSTIQFKIAFSTIGLTCIPDKVYGIGMSYFSDGIPLSTTFYEPSLKHSDISSQIFAWRQVHEFVDNIPELSIDIYNVSGNTLLLTDTVSGSTNGTWEYSSDNGNNWSGFTSSANTIDNYIRYTPNSSLGTGIKVKPILYETATQIYVSSPPSPSTVLDLDAQLFLGIANITDTTITNAINQLVIDLKNANIWIKMLGLYPFVGGTATTHQWNLKNPNEFLLTFTGGWTHNSLGILMNNSNTTATTGIGPNNGNRSMSAYLTQRQTITISTQGAIMGSFNSGMFALRATTTQDLFHNEAGSIGKAITPAVLHPFLGNSRTASNSWFAQNDTNVFTTYTDAASAVSSGINIGNITNTTWRGAHQLGFAHVGEPLTQSEMTDLRTAVINFQTTLGRNV